MIHKNGKPKRDPLSYRPLSLTSSIGKIYEKIIAKRVYAWAENNNKFSSAQNGFRANRSINDNLFKLIECVKTGFVKKQRTGAVFLDVEKAFDQVWHKGLIFKLYSIGMPKKTILWICSYLKDRSMIIEMEKLKGEEIKPTHGVPQGSPLSPLLFILYVSDIPELTKGVFISQFADDIAIWTTSRIITTINSRLNSSLNVLQKWCSKWKIKLNPTKTKPILFKYKKNKSLDDKDFSIKMGDQNIKDVKEVKFLGVILDDKLKLDTFVSDKINKLLGIRKQIFKMKYKDCVSLRILVILYKVFLRSKIEFGLPALIIAKKDQMNRLESFQHRILSHFLDYPRSVNRISINNQCNLTSVNERINELSKKWFKKSMINNPDIKSFVEKLPVFRNNHGLPSQLVT